jgi:hypothetical protein
MLFVLQRTSIKKSAKITEILPIYNIDFNIQYCISLAMVEYTISNQDANKEVRQEILTVLTMEITFLLEYEAVKSGTYV